MCCWDWTLFLPGLIADTSAVRRAIQRALANLIEQNVIQAQGQARARVYTLTQEKNVLPFVENDNVFNNIYLSEQSNELLSLFLVFTKIMTSVFCVIYTYGPINDHLNDTPPCNNPWVSLTCSS